ncbi:MAG: hypothetical protein H6611_00195 [Ignavibacteriales bacterium]|nr:hypothetical protein [Ignavibacteriales bacterium]
MGLSFVSKVAPLQKMKGLIMGVAFGATAVGNYLAGFEWKILSRMGIVALFLILIVCASLAALMAVLTF